MDEASKYINKVIRDYEDSDNPYVWAIEYKENGKMIGTIELYSLSHKNRWCELESDMNPEYWNKGLNTEALKAVINFCFTELNLNKVQARCYEKNRGSAKVLQKAGMIYDGVQRQHFYEEGVFHNIFWYSILRKDFEVYKLLNTF